MDNLLGLHWKLHSAWYSYSCRLYVSNPAWASSVSYGVDTWRLRTLSRPYQPKRQTSRCDIALGVINVHGCCRVREYDRLHCSNAIDVKDCASTHDWKNAFTRGRLEFQKRRKRPMKSETLFGFDPVVSVAHRTSRYRASVRVLVTVPFP
jgi:hypothetical protein